MGLVADLVAFDPALITGSDSGLVPFDGGPPGAAALRSLPDSDFLGV